MQTWRTSHSQIRRHEAPVSTAMQATYLGGSLSIAYMHIETKLRIKDVKVTLQRVRVFWRHGNCTVRFVNAVLRTMIFAEVLNGLESAELRETTL